MVDPLKSVRARVNCTWIVRRYTFHKDVRSKQTQAPCTVAVPNIVEEELDAGGSNHHPRALDVADDVEQDHQLDDAQVATERLHVAVIETHYLVGQDAQEDDVRGEKPGKGGVGWPRNQESWPIIQILGEIEVQDV